MQEAHKLLSAGCYFQSEETGMMQVWENTPGCGEVPFLDTVWTSIDEAVTLQDCEVYSYKSDGETDPFGDHQLLHHRATAQFLTSCKAFEAVIIISTRGLILTVPLICQELDHSAHVSGQYSTHECTTCRL